MEDEGEEPFMALDSLLEVNLVEDTTGCAPTLSKGDSSKDCGQENKMIPENAVDSSVGHVKNTGMNNSMAYSNLDAVQIAWGMDLEEDTFYKDLFKDLSMVRFLRLHCTVCDAHLGCKPGSVLMRHVRLGTLICKVCFTFYGAGEFPVAEDGSESFCYWCGQGGSVICCSICSAVFCKKCIRRNYTKSMIREIESSNEWLCFVCNYRSLWEHRAVCRAAITYESSHDSLKGDEAENESPGLNEDLCCAPGVERRLPRLKSSMPSGVSFVEYIKAGRVRVSIMKILRNASVTGNASECISLDSNVACKTEKVISTDMQNKALTQSGGSKEMVSSEPSVKTNHSYEPKAQDRVASHNIPCVDIGAIGPLNSQTCYSRPTTGLPFITRGVRPNFISNSHVIPTGRVVVMPPVHIPHRASVIRLPAAGATVAQQNSPVDALSLGALLSSSPPIGSVPQPPNPVFRFQNGTSPFVVVSDSNRVSSVPVVVRSSSGAYVPMYVNNTANVHYIPNESSQINAVPYYVQNKGTVSHPNQQQEKSENSMSYHNSSVINNATTCQVTANGQTALNVLEAPLTSTAKSNSVVKEKSKTKSGYIQVRSPTALQSVTVSDIEHSVPEVRGSVTCAVPKQQSVHNPLFPGCPSGTVPSAPTSLAKDQNVHNSVLAESHLQNALPSRLTPTATNSGATSLLKNILTDEARCNTSDTGADPPSPINSTFSSKEIPQAPTMNQTCQDLALRSTDAIETKWFKENLLEAENVAKYMLTRITCVQEELESKSSQKQSFGNLVNHYSKLLEIATKKLTDVSSNFTANLKKCKEFSTSCQTDLSQRLRANTEKQSNVETNNGQKTSADDVHNNNNTSHEEVEVVSVKITGNRSSRKRCNSGSEISPAVTCATERGPGSTQDSTSSVFPTDSSEVDTQVAKPKNVTYPPPRMSTRRSKAYRGSAKFAAKCCMSSCISDIQVHKKRMDFQQNMGSSCNKSRRLLEQAKYIHIPEKRRKLKEVRIVLERINNPGMTCKREVDNSNVIKGSTNDDSDGQSLEAVAVLKDQSYLGPDALIKKLKPCSVVLHRLDHRDITHCI